MMQVEKNISNQLDMIKTAVASGAKLVVLPECSTTGWVFESKEEVGSVAELVPSGPTCQKWLEICRENEIYVVAGIVELEGSAVYNASVLFGPSGLIGKFRKVHLWWIEKELYTPGNLGFPVFDTPLGRIGMHICYDGWFSEAYRLPALHQADLLCVPANWVPVPEQKSALPVMANMLCMTNAHINLMYVAAASRVGVERGQVFIGNSVIADHSGWPLAGPASSTEEEMISAVIDPIGTRADRIGNTFNQPLADRRTDVYDVREVYTNPAVHRMDQRFDI